MSEYRQDPLSRRWVIIGSDRSLRPNEFVEQPIRQPVPCPFCAGHEQETPDSVAEYRTPLHSGWQVRVVPNKFPAVTTDELSPVHCQPLSSAAAAKPIAGFGRHEVIIESPRHIASVSDLTASEAQFVVQAYRERILAHKSTGQFRFVQIFRNVGPGAGATLEHLHSQLVALPGVPEVVATKLTSCREYFARHRLPLLVDVIQSEIAGRDRLILQTDSLIAWCPHASRFPYEVCIAPLRPAGSFEDAQPGELDDLSRVIPQLIGRIEAAAPRVSYNCVLFTQPFDTSPHDHYHWHIEIIPRLTKVAGFEWGTGCFINPLPPEIAAARLRAVLPAKSDCDSADQKK